jgi:hypothetical protein
VTVYEALQKLDTPHEIFRDRLGIGKEKIERLLRNMEYSPARGCWLWRLSKIKGYGVVRIRSLSSSLLPVHRLCYELVFGVVDKALHVHHRTEPPINCYGRACGNPFHVLPLTPKEHVVDYTPGSASFEAAHRDVCAAGHPYTEESTRIVKGGFRQCRICDRIRQQQYRDEAHPDRQKFKKDPAKLKTHCLRGHPYTGDHVYFVQTKWGPQRRCRLCDRIREQDFRNRKKELDPP